MSRCRALSSFAHRYAASSHFRVDRSDERTLRRASRKNRLNSFARLRHPTFLLGVRYGFVSFYYFSYGERLRRCAARSSFVASIAVFSAGDNRPLTTLYRGKEREGDGGREFVQRQATRGVVVGASEISENLWLRPPRISREGARETS